jgi:hypothetical protein
MNPQRRPSGRALQRYREMQDFQDSTNRPYIHLVDGGVSDNIGVRGVLESLEELAASAAFREEVGFGVIRRIVLFVVNSRSSPSTDWDRLESPPGFAVQLLQSAGVPIDRYSFETVETMKDRAEIVAWRRDGPYRIRGRPVEGVRLTPCWGPAGAARSGRRRARRGGPAAARIGAGLSPAFCSGPSS